MYEVGYFYQNIWTTLVNAAEGEVEIFNENFFRDLSAYYMDWELLEDGQLVRSGRVDNLNVAPQQTVRMTLALGEMNQNVECLRCV